MAELKLKVSKKQQVRPFGISALFLEVTLKMQAHFWHPWPLGQKVVPPIFERWSSNKVMEGNVQEGSVFAAYL